MTGKKQIRIVLDVVMTSVLLFLMASQVTGDKYHEWLGAGMLLLFLIHNGLNWNWYKAFFQGNDSALRIVRSIINLAVLAAILITGYSGIVLSRHVFAFLPIHGGMATARRLHLAGSYWSFVLMSMHLGMHWSMVLGKIKALEKARVIAFATAIYGAILFIRAEIFQNMFLQNEFAMLDYETPGVFIILQNLAMMSMWIFVGHYLSKSITIIFSKTKKTKISKMEEKRT